MYQTCTCIRMLQENFSSLKFLVVYLGKTLYSAFIPAVTYSISVWGGMNRSDDFDSLERLHCRAARVIFNFPKDLPSVEALIRAKWDTENLI